ncbi:MAG: glycosyltransferase family 39 protein, partial [Fimbriimonadaceae bacterium]|nr:glycosyltransferase family 39 protein [Fimbriimonadaceae bacterium]
MPMLGVLIALLLAFALIGCIRPMIVHALGVTDQAAGIGLAGLVGLGSAGTLLFFAGLIDVQAAIYGTSILVVLLGATQWIRYRKGLSIAFSRPQGLDLLFPLAIGLALLMALAGVLAPSTATDWDSLAYHLAVPKIWLETGTIDVIPTIHQSNFPFAVDSLFLIGLKWGGQAGAKAFVWIYTLLGAMAIFGLARQRYGQRAGWWACLVFTTLPAVLWLSGTAYVDVAHGLYAGLGLIFACWWLESNDSKHAWLSAIMLGFALGTKYTGLQTLAVAGLVALVVAFSTRRNHKPVFLIGLVALAIGSPWYVKNEVWKGNPVFPFFYSKLGGKDWDQRRAEIYTNEQNTFGVGREVPPTGPIQPQRLGHSVLGLAYQPGRYVNPMQTAGGGDPMGAVGIAVVGALMLGMFAGQRGKFERALLAGVLISLGIWFVLTQQSRYILTLSVPLALIAGQLTTRRGFGVLMGGVAVVQALMSLYILNS